MELVDSIVYVNKNTDTQVMNNEETPSLYNVVQDEDLFFSIINEELKTINEVGGIGAKPLISGF
jgi:hypothetical protein